MGTLLLRLAAPIQAWGDESKYDIRGTQNEPTKSGVIGLLAAAMGFRRDSDQISKLAYSLRLGIRVDQPGRVIRDFHIVRVPKYGKNGIPNDELDGKISIRHTYTTQRYYLSDACFLVGLESDDEELLHNVAEALKSPVFPVYLGRRSLPPSMPLILGIRSSDLETVLRETEWLAAEWYKDKYKCIRARIITETRRGQNAWYTQMDHPVSFSPIHRRYSLRGLNKEQYVLLGTPEHDPMAAL